MFDFYLHSILVKYLSVLTEGNYNDTSGNRVSSVGDTRSIYVGVKEVPPEQHRFTNNRVKTSKYTIWNFVPKNLFEQFRRIANFYFLVMSVISITIESPVSPLTSILPLIFVILVTAVKQAYEDWLRFRSDKEVNCYPVTVIRNGCLQELQSQEVKVGDVVKVLSDTEVPCDLVLLSTSDSSGKCYITTANLDGETNLKTLFCPRMLRFLAVNEQLAQLKARVDCEQPNPDLYRFFGKIRLLPSLVPATQSQFEEMSLPNPDSVLYLQGNSAHNSKLSIKSAKNSIRRHIRSVSFYNGGITLNHRPYNESPRASAGSGPTPRVSITSDFSQRSVDCSLYNPASPRLHRTRTFRESKRSDVRNGRSSFLPRAYEEETTLAAEDIRRASDLGLSAPLGPENLLLRGHRLKNTDFVYGCAVYTGQETKLALNSKMTSIKFSSVERSINRFLLFFLVLLIFETLLSLMLKYITEANLKDIATVFSYVGDFPSKTARSVIQDLFSFVILYNYIIPISLYVTIEMQKFLGTLFFEWDLQLYDDQMKQPAICNTSDLNEELGQIEYLFTDKTGTLTENNMWFRRCAIDGVVYLELEGRLYTLPSDGNELKKVPVERLTPELEQFLLAMAVCHSVQVHNGGSSNNNSLMVDGGSNLEYQASSPDEKAFVEASARLGVVFLGERDDEIFVRQHDTVRRFQILNCLEFTSDRKRMSVVVQDEDSVVWLYCKGAESHVIPLVTRGNIQETLASVGEFAVRGLRAMVFGYRRLAQPEYAAHAQNIDTSRQNLTSLRENLITESYNKMEDGLTLLGATGVEDQLQEGVQEALESLRAAGIKVWILTGDKVETAVNISFSCGHFKNGTILLYLTEKKSSRSCAKEIELLRKRVFEEKLDQYGLIVDGASLTFALKERDGFLELCQASTAVICCRMSPLQKCEVVQLMKNSPHKPITAAIGDGANDVSMIQEAHVGLGIMGKEGRQAVRCADFAFSKFRFVRRVLLVHGHWYYLRIATLVQYFFYKNIVFITPQLYYAFFNAYSTQPLYDSWFLTLFNVMFAALPILLYGLFEQNYSANQLLSYPQLYKTIRRDSLMTWSCFFQWNLLGLWHSLVLFFLPYFMFSYNEAILVSNTPVDQIGFGTLIFHCVVCVVNLKLWLYTRYWTWLFLASIVFSIAAFILFALAYSAIFLVSTSSMFWVYLQLASSPSFWLLTLVLVVLSLLPDCALTVLGPHLNTGISRIKQYMSTRRKLRGFPSPACCCRESGSFTTTNGSC